MTYSRAGHVAQPKSKLSSSKNELPSRPIETNEEHQKLNSIEEFVWKNMKYFSTPIFQVFSLVSGWRFAGQ